MAWWDHEELKEKHLRSDRYIVSFPNKYSKFEVEQAHRRLHEQDLQNEISQLRRKLKEKIKELNELQK